ncbi:hypothetical protein BSKO_07944 [Bryopsis sp. KO-2023]|nr:hypothetical protein BSKO_07944 [Bryopsis sp. KO-2023]
MAQPGELTEYIFFEQAKNVKSIVADAVRAPASSENLFQKFSTILSIYQESPELLDPHLESILTPLTTCLREQAGRDDITAADEAVKQICRFLQCVTSVRGHKCVIKFYPVDVESFGPVLRLLDRFKPGIVGYGVWETQCQLMLWLSALVLIPFDLSILDDSSDGAGETPGPVQEVLQICDGFLEDAGTVRDFACILMYKVFSRADMHVALIDFLKRARDVLSKVDDAQNAKEVFRLIGVTQAVGWAFKHCQREILLEASNDVWPWALELVRSKSAESNVLLRTLAVKLCQRIGMTWLIPRTLTWRYVKKTGELGSDLTPEKGNEPHQNPIRPDSEEEGWDIPEELESVLEVLLEGIKDKDTAVRWSAAKGIGRICGRLPKDLVEDVVSSIMEIISPVEPEMGWHGACLTIAEMARRGLLLPEVLPSIVPLVESALMYDVNKGSYSIGAPVRDAACYVCWACARSYEPEILAPYMGSFAQVLMVVACTDREVNCRRAASAAYQECVGRISNVPNGIEILNSADYFSLSARPQAFREVTPKVASFSHYRQKITQHLIHVKLRHWEIEVRELAADALEKLVPLSPDYFATEGLELVLGWCLDDVLNVRHGAALGLSSILLGLSRNGISISEGLQKRVGNIVMDIEKARLYRGKGGEIMRAGVCHIIRAVAESGISDPPRRRARLMESVEANIRHPKEEIKSKAILALYSLSRKYGDSEIETGLEKLTRKFMADLHSENVAIRRGYAAGMGALPRKLLLPLADEVLQGLSKATRIEEDPDDRDAESRVAAVTALKAVILEMYGGGGNEVSEEELLDVRGTYIEVFLDAMEDYCVDNRGDVGSWIRNASMESLRLILAMLSEKSSKHLVTEDLLVRVVGLILRNCVERISRMRENAAHHLKLLLEVPDLDIPLRTELTEMVDGEEQIARFGMEEVMTIMKQFLASPQYQAHVLEGFVASIGGLQKTLADAAVEALISHVGGFCVLNDESSAQAFGELVLKVWEKHSRSNRMSTPMLKTVGHILKKSRILDHARGCFAGDVVDMVKREIQGCKDIPRLLAGATVTSILALENNDFASKAWGVLAVLLGNRFPRVRRGAADILYEELLFHMEVEKSVELTEVLLDTAWDGPINQVLVARAALCSIVGIEAPKRKKGADALLGKEAEVDENSYQALVADFARGI